MKTLFKLFVIISLCLSASCTNEEIPTVQADGKKHTCIMDVAVTIAGYDGVTRSSEDNVWENGDRMYITFYTGYVEPTTGVAEYSVEESAWVLTYTGALPTDGYHDCLVRFFKNATHEEETVSLTAHSISYKSSDATYMYDGNVLRVSAYLAPSTGRVRFVSNEEQTFFVSGVIYNTSYTLLDDVVGRNTASIPLTTHAVSDTTYTTDYIYVSYADTANCSLSIRSGSQIFSKSFPAEMLQASASGYIKLPTSQSHNGWDLREAYEYVDLGLPSGLLWATFNVGATAPEEYGNHYAWGEIETKDDYSVSSSLTYGMELGDISGNPQYDAAAANWGGEWRMPTKAEFDELLNNCTWEWTTQNEVNGYLVTGPNGNSIFLPAAGYRDGTSLYGDGSYGYYWSSTPYGSNNAYLLGFYSGYHYTNWDYRYYGRSVRPVMSGQTVAQEFVLETTEIMATQSAASYSVNVNSSVVWNAEVSAAWVTLSSVFADWTSTNNNQHGSTSQNEYTFNVAAGNVLSFDWAVSSETNYDWLTVTLNDEQIVRRSGEYSESFTRTFETAGTYTLVVTYSKDGSESAGSDMGRIYNVVLSKGDATTFCGSGNSTLQVTVDENSTYESRSTAIAFRRNSDNVDLGTLAVTQEGIQEYFTLETTGLTVASTAAEYTFGINTNIAWNAEVSENWLRVTGAHDDWTSDNHEHGSTSLKEYTLDVAAGSTLEFDWLVSSEGSFDWLTVTLDGEQILRESGVKSGHFSRTLETAGLYTLVVTYSKDGSASNGDDLGRIYNINLSGSTSSVQKVVVDETPLITSRTAVVTFRRNDNGNELGTLTVTQVGRHLYVSHEQIELSSDGGESYVVTIDAVGEYTISQSGSWFVVNHDVENRCFTVTADAYSESTDRTGTVTVELTGQPDGESKSVTIEVIQYSKDVDVDVDGFEDEKEWN